MSAEDRIMLCRELAAQARKLAANLNHDEAAKGLLRFAEEQDAKAASLEKEARR